jgi:hypothetical protein
MIKPFNKPIYVTKPFLPPLELPEVLINRK